MIEDFLVSLEVRASILFSIDVLDSPQSWSYTLCAIFGTLTLLYAGHTLTGTSFSSPAEERSQRSGTSEQEASQTQQSSNGTRQQPAESLSLHSHRTEIDENVEERGPYHRCVISPGSLAGDV
jgi:hypothetical protein